MDTTGHCTRTSTGGCYDKLTPHGAMAPLNRLYASSKPNHLINLIYQSQRIGEGVNKQVNNTQLLGGSGSSIPPSNRLPVRGPQSRRDPARDLPLCAGAAAPCGKPRH